MSTSRNPFQPASVNRAVVDQLRPDGPGASNGGVLQLTPTSVSPTIVVGRDRKGRPIEETIPNAFWVFMIDLQGNLCRIPMRTGGVFSMEPEAERYQHQQMRDLVGSGWLVLDQCPHWPGYLMYTSHLIANPDRIVDCPGDANGGCSHLKEVIALRKADAHAEHLENERSFTQMTPGAAATLMRQVGQAMGMISDIAAEDTAPVVPPKKARAMKEEG